MNIQKYSATKLASEIEKMSDKKSIVVQKFIDAGRGAERPTEIFNQTDDLSLKYRELALILCDLVNEKQRRIAYHGNLKPIKEVSY